MKRHYCKYPFKFVNMKEINFYWGSYYKLGYTHYKFGYLIYYKTGKRLLKIGVDLLQMETAITNCDNCCKLVYNTFNIFQTAECNF